MSEKSSDLRCLLSKTSSDFQCLSYDTFCDQYQQKLLKEIESTKRQFEKNLERYNDLLAKRWSKFCNVVYTIQNGLPETKVFVFSYDDLYGIHDVLKDALESQFQTSVTVEVEDTNVTDGDEEVNDEDEYEYDPASYRSQYYQYTIKF
jgi:hypothetical protein